MKLFACCVWLRTGGESEELRLRRLATTLCGVDSNEQTQVHGLLSSFGPRRHRTCHQEAVHRRCSVLQYETPYSFHWNSLCRQRCELHTRFWTRLYHRTSANASSAASTHGRYARRLRHCSSSRSLAPTSRNVLFDAPRRLSRTHFLRLSSEAIHCLYSNLS